MQQNFRLQQQIVIIHQIRTKHATKQLRATPRHSATMRQQRPRHNKIKNRKRKKINAYNKKHDLLQQLKINAQIVCKSRAVTKSGFLPKRTNNQPDWQATTSRPSYDCGLMRLLSGRCWWSLRLQYLIVGRRQWDAECHQLHMATTLSRSQYVCMYVNVCIGAHTQSQIALFVATSCFCCCCYCYFCSRYLYACG